MAVGNNNPDFCARLEYVIGKSPDNKKAFAKKCGISEKQLYVYLKGASEPGMRFFSAMKCQYPFINIEWVITGEGLPLFNDDKGQYLGKGECPHDESIVSYENIVEAEHLKLIKKFKNKELAKSINSKLVELEQMAPDELDEIDGYLDHRISRRLQKKQKQWNSFSKKLKKI